MIHYEKMIIKYTKENISKYLIRGINPRIIILVQGTNEYIIKILITDQINITFRFLLFNWQFVMSGYKIFL